jgi:hypothetical protein
MEKGSGYVLGFSMFTRVCKEGTIAEGGMRIVIADAHVIVLAWPKMA